MPFRWIHDMSRQRREAEVRNAVRKGETSGKSAPAQLLPISATGLLLIAGAGLLVAWTIGTAAFLTWGGG
jgi:hypothetical protein